jgi:hypothetical protein
MKKTIRAPRKRLQGKEKEKEGKVAGSIRTPGGTMSAKS